MIRLALCPLLRGTREVDRLQLHAGFEPVVGLLLVELEAPSTWHQLF